MAGKIELSVDISVEWRRSATWGMCPTATVDARLSDAGVTIRRDHGSGHASGCGYDKRSAAVDEAMLGGADRDAVFEAWRDDADPVSGDMYFDVEKLPGYIETAKGGKRNA